MLDKSLTVFTDRSLRSRPYTREYSTGFIQERISIYHKYDVFTLTENSCIETLTPEVIFILPKRWDSNKNIIILVTFE